MSAADIASPCVNICRMDEDNALCLGCLRTLEEITQWSRVADETKLAILAAVAKRRELRGELRSELRGEQSLT